MYPPAVSQAERRTSERHLSNRVCYASPNGTHLGVAWGVTLCDISATGLSLRLHCKLRVGTILMIQPFRDSRARPLVARIVRAASHGGRGWFYGCLLADSLDEAELDAWLA